MEESRRSELEELQKQRIELAKQMQLLLESDLRKLEACAEVDPPESNELEPPKKQQSELAKQLISWAKRIQALPEREQKLIKENLAYIQALSGRDPQELKASSSKLHPFQTSSENNELETPKKQRSSLTERIQALPEREQKLIKENLAYIQALLERDPQELKASSSTLHPSIAEVARASTPSSTQATESQPRAVVSEQQVLRRSERDALIDGGVDPYPSASYPVSTSSREVLEAFDDAAPQAMGEVCLAGRIMARRLMGAACFVEMEDSSGRIQVYLQRDNLCPGSDKSLYNDVFKKKVSMGDIIGVRGFVFRTQRGEISIEARSFTLLSKALRPLPVVKQSRDEEGVTRTHDAFTDTEQRYRQRYVDLIVNPEVRDRFRARTKIIDTIRSYFNQRDFLEVETPVLQPIWGGASARPFVTKHHVLDVPLYLRIANELYLKRLIVGGFDGVYEFSKDFRNEGMSRFHNPEFTQVELYVAYKDYLWMADFVEEMLSSVAKEMKGSLLCTYQGQTIDLKPPWRRTTFFEAIEAQTGMQLEASSFDELRASAQQLKVSVEESDHEGRILDKIFGQYCEPTFVNPTIVMDYPVSISPLAKAHRSRPRLVERFEVICNGKEVCNAYSELNDPVVQRARFEDQLKQSRKGDPEAPSVVDEDFLRALEYGMPPTAGLGVGIDRLAMLLLDAPSIQDVLFFPQMRPEQSL